jgi:flagellar biosynthesis anti-sigma factor FlgM
VKIEPKNQQKIHAPASSQTCAMQGSHPAAIRFGDGLTPITPSAGCHVVLSARAAQFRRIRGQLEALSTPPNVARVAELRSLISRGVYSVDGGVIAAAMLDDDAVGRALAIR